MSGNSPAPQRSYRFLQQTRFIGDKVLYARQHISSKPPVVGGTPITEELAASLRNVIFGTTMSPPKSDWMKTAICLKDPDKDNSYCLRGAKGSTRGLMTVVQAEIIKFALYGNLTDNRSAAEKLRLNAAAQVEALVVAITNILWRVGDRSRACLALLQDKSYMSNSGSYFVDGITEKINIFEITDFEELRIVVKRYLYMFCEDPCCGALLLLYSAVITRQPDKVMKDLSGVKKQLVTTTDEEGTLCIATLLLAGRATPYLHNGVVYVGDEDHYAVPQYGILSRSEIGLLVHGNTKKSEDDDDSNRPGSRLKTPSLPVWVVCGCGRFGVFFNINRDLLHNYHAERRFDLYYNACGEDLVKLTVDTRATDEEQPAKRDDAPQGIQVITKLVHAKWPDAHVTWHDTANI